MCFTTNEKPGVLITNRKTIPEICIGCVEKHLDNTEEIIWDWKNLHNKELQYFRFLQSITSNYIWNFEIGRTCNTHGMRNAYKIFVERIEGNLSVERRVTYTWHYESRLLVYGMGHNMVK